MIGLITAATVAVGALGGIAGVAFDPDPVPKDNVIQPGGDEGTRLAPQSLGSPGNSAPHGSQRQVAVHVAGPGLRRDLVAELGGQRLAGHGWVHRRADRQRHRPRPTPTPTDGGATCEGGCGVDHRGDRRGHLRAAGLDASTSQDDNRVFQSDGHGQLLRSRSATPTTRRRPPATSSRRTWRTCCRRRTTPSCRPPTWSPLEPFGSVVSLAGIEYEALWVDNQGSISIHGQIYVGRPPGRHRARHPGRAHPGRGLRVGASRTWSPILDNSYTRFGGLGWLGPDRSWAGR